MNVHKKVIESCNKYKRRICAKEREGISVIKRRVRGGMWVHIWIIEVRVIRPSKSPQMAPVFFVTKKDRKKWIVQNYRYLNKWTVKNNYPLSLISDIIENIGTKKVFTKIDLW